MEKEEPIPKDDVVNYEKFLSKKAKKQRKNRLIVNSETSHDCWFIENPSSKELTKRITLKLGPKCEQEFIIVLRAPSKLKKNPMVSFLNLELTGIEEEALEKVWRQKYKDSYTYEEIENKKRMQIMMCGVIEPPRLICPKSVFDAHA